MPRSVEDAIAQIANDTAYLKRLAEENSRDEPYRVDVVSLKSPRNFYANQILNAETRYFGNLRDAVIFVKETRDNENRKDAQITYGGRVIKGFLYDYK